MSIASSPASSVTPAPNRTMPIISAEVADWSRERSRRSFFDAGAHMLRAIRRYKHWKNRWGVIGRCICKCSSVQNHLWGLLSGCYLPIDGTYGGGMVLPHPQGIVIHTRVRIGVNCMIFHQVTIGMSHQGSGVPVIGGHVDIGAGAKILGGVVVGDHAKIGANAVVITDVPPGATAVGVPARIILPAR